MEVAFVIQRYGKQIVGGAESHARQIAERLASDLGWKVHVFTTTAKDYRSWDNFFPEGLESINGVLVHRFNSSRSRNPRVFDALNGFLSRLILFLNRIWIMQPLGRAIETFWYKMQGPVCPNLLKELSEQQAYFDHIFFFTYLYYPTIHGLRLFKEKATLIPTAHDESPLYFAHSRKLFYSAQRILANTEAEARLITRVYPKAQSHIKVVGLGFDEYGLDPENISSLFELPIEGPFIVYLGRISYGKRVDELLAYFLKFLEKSANKNLSLVLAGEVEAGFSLTSHPQVKLLGFVAEDRKAKLIRDAKCLVNPSSNESLSMVVIEALALKVPVLVNCASEVLADYAAHQDSVFGYNNKEEFCTALGEILAQDWSKNAARQETLSRGRAWAIEKFSWEKVLSTYQAVVEHKI